MSIATVQKSAPSLAFWRWRHALNLLSKLYGILFKRLHSRGVECGRTDFENGHVADMSCRLEAERMQKRKISAPNKQKS